MKIIVEDIVTSILYATSWDESINSFQPEKPILLPALVDLLWSWKATFFCPKCHSSILIGYQNRKSEYIARFSLGFSDYQTTEYIDYLSKIFNLELRDLGIDLNGNKIYYYRLNGHSASIFYNRCKCCSAQYLFCKSGQGGDRDKSGDLYLDPIKFITCDEGELLQWASKTLDDPHAINPNFKNNLPLGGKPPETI